jgi:hypothetical protein
MSAGLLIGGKAVQEEATRVNAMNILVATPGGLFVWDVFAVAWLLFCFCFALAVLLLCFCRPAMRGAC